MKDFVSVSLFLIGLQFSSFCIFLLEIQLVGGHSRFLGQRIFDFVNFNVVISLVQGYVEKSVDHGVECFMFVLSKVN